MTKDPFFGGLLIAAIIAAITVALLERHIDHRAPRECWQGMRIGSDELC